MTQNFRLRKMNAKRAVFQQQTAFNQPYEKSVFCRMLVSLNVRGFMAPKQKLRLEKERLKTKSAKSCDLIEVPVLPIWPAFLQERKRAYFQGVVSTRLKTKSS